MEKTNDRDYEIEERYAYSFLSSLFLLRALMHMVDVTGRWRLQRIAYRKKQRDTWIHYEVRKLDMTFVIRVRN